MDDTKAEAAQCLESIRQEFAETPLPDDIKASAFEVIERLDELFRPARQEKETVALMVGSLPVVDHVGPAWRWSKRWRSANAAQATVFQPTSRR